MGNIAAIYELGQVGDDCCLESAPQDIEQSKNENQNPYPRKVSGMGDLTLAEKTDLQICPTCKKQSLFLNQTDDTYECLNQKCSDYRHQFLKISVDRYYEQLAAEKKALDELSNAKTHAWVGNQYYDEKKKKWCDGDKPIRAHQVPAWLVVVLAFVIISVLVTLILNYYHPGSHFIIF